MNSNIDNDESYTVTIIPPRQELSFKWAKADPVAVSPFKAIESDSGHDLTLVKHLKTVNDVYFYDTCIRVEPPDGYYFELVGRSSISKSGWMLANSIGIIDTTYRGNIIVALTRTHAHAPVITLPSRLVQIIPKKLHILRPVEVPLSEISSTDRGDGGFGSTNS